MPQIQLSDHIFNAAQRRAVEAGFSSVDDYIADMLAHDADADDDNLDHLFTPEVVAHLDKISDDLKLGSSVSLEAVEQHLADVRKTWVNDHAS